MSFNVLEFYRKCAQYGTPGKWFFSRVFCFKAPYFFTIRPHVDSLEVNKAIVSMPHRFMHNNHIGTQHAIACCNLVEMTMGCVMESSIPKTLRWIPAGMQVKYVAKAVGRLTATSELPEDFFSSEKVPGNVEVPIVVKDPDDQVVVTASISVYVSEKVQKSKL